MIDDLHNRLVSCFASVFSKVPPDQLDSLNVARCADWDSLATVTLMAVLEQEFAISISPEEYENLQSFGLVRTMLESKLDD